MVDRRTREPRFTLVLPLLGLAACASSGSRDQARAGAPPAKARAAEPAPAPAPAAAAPAPAATPAPARAPARPAEPGPVDELPPGEEPAPAPRATAAREPASPRPSRSRGGFGSSAAAAVGRTVSMGDLLDAVAGDLQIEDPQIEEKDHGETEEERIERLQAEASRGAPPEDRGPRRTAPVARDQGDPFTAVLTRAEQAITSREWGAYCACMTAETRASLATLLGGAAVYAARDLEREGNQAAAQVLRTILDRHGLSAAVIEGSSRSAREGQRLIAAAMRDPRAFIMDMGRIMSLDRRSAPGFRFFLEGARVQGTRTRGAAASTTLITAEGVPLAAELRSEGGVPVVHIGRAAFQAYVENEFEVMFSTS